MKPPNKACPVLIRERLGVRHILVFNHPNPEAGVQLVKGTIERGEHPADTALRELVEETGITDAVVMHDLGTWEADYQEQIWSFHQCETVSQLPEQWNHFCQDDGGHLFSFFWHPLHQEPGKDWHWLFRNALVYIRSVL